MFRLQGRVRKLKTTLWYNAGSPPRPNNGLTGPTPGKCARDVEQRGEEGSDPQLWIGISKSTIFQGFRGLAYWCGSLQVNLD